MSEILEGTMYGGEVKAIVVQVGSDRIIIQTLERVLGSEEVVPINRELRMFPGSTPLELLRIVGFVPTSERE